MKDKEILYRDDLVSMSKSIENLKEKFLKWKEAFKSKGLKVNLKKTRRLLAQCGKKVMANSVMCTKCCKWVHGRCAKMKRVTSILAKGFVCELCVNTMEGIAEPSKEISFFDQIKFVKSLVI